MSTYMVTVEAEQGQVRWDGVQAATPLDALREALVQAATDSVMQPELPFMLTNEDGELLMRLLHEALTAPHCELTFNQRREGAMLQMKLGEFLGPVGLEEGP